MDQHTRAAFFLLLLNLILWSDKAVIRTRMITRYIQQEESQNMRMIHGPTFSNSDPKRLMDPQEQDPFESESEILLLV